MSWLYLLLAGVFEIGWPVGLKMAQQPHQRWRGIDYCGRGDTEVIAALTHSSLGQATCSL